jgi:hypothetical protein
MVLPVFDYCDVAWDTLNDTALTQTRKNYKQEQKKIIDCMYQLYELNIASFSQKNALLPF